MWRPDTQRVSTATLRKDIAKNMQRMKRESVVRTRLGVKSIVPYLSFPASLSWSLSIQYSELHPSPYVLFPQLPPPRFSPLTYVSIVFTNQGLAEKLTIPQATKQLSQFHETRMFITCSEKPCCQANSVHSLSSYLIRIHFNIIPLSRDRSSRWYRSLGLRHRSPVGISIQRHTPSYPAYLIFIQVTTQYLVSSTSHEARRCVFFFTLVFVLRLRRKWAEKYTGIQLV